MYLIDMENNKKMLHLFQLLLGKECSHCLFYFTTILLINKNMFNFKKHGMKKTMSQLLLPYYF